MKYLGRNLRQEVKNVYNENFKLLKIENNSRKWIDI